MNRIDLECMDKTYQSYRAALAEILEICPKVESSSSSSNGREGLVTSLDAGWGVTDKKQMIRHATSMSVGWDSLMDWGRPKIIQPGFSTWDSNFFYVRIYIERPFELFRWDAAWAPSEEYIDEEGNLHPATPGRPAAINPWWQGKITLLVSDCHPRWGLKHWYTKADEIAHYADEAPPKLRDYYAERYKRANEEVEQWKRALAEIQVHAVSL